MDSFLLGAVSALWLGILTSISPCPMATNVAAISYIGSDANNTRRVMLSGLLYSLGRIITYTVLGSLLVASMLSATKVSFFLQENMNKLLGPILVLAGMFLLELIKFSLPGKGVSQRFQTRVKSFGVWGAALIGILFALSFCPVSAALFFGSLIPLAVEHQSSLLFPAIFGLGTGLPIFVFALVLAFSARSLGKVFQRLTDFERWARRVTGSVFLLIGLYYCLKYIFRLL